MDDFWDWVAIGHARELHGGFLSAPLEQIDFGDGKGHFSRIHAASGDTYVDADLSLIDSPYPYLCARVTADEFKDAIRMASERGFRAMKDYVLGVLGALAAIGGLAAFAWLCMAASDYGWR
jgi:hypothetical protein